MTDQRETHSALITASNNKSESKKEESALQRDPGEFIVHIPSLVQPLAVPH